MLGWTPAFTLDAALGETVAWYRAWLAGEGGRA
jgi:nucleoside-diphosphate-sugar epimerase